MADIVAGYNGTATYKDLAKTVCDRNNAANKTGNINVVQLKIISSSSCKVVPFYLNGSTMMCRGGAVSLGTIIGGSYQTITGLSMPITQGDFIGMYSPTGIYYTSGSLAGYYATSDKTAAGNTLSSGFGNVQMAIYGEGSLAAAGGGGILMGSIFNSDILHSRILRG